MERNQEILRTNVYQSLAYTIGNAKNEEIEFCNFKCKVFLPSSFFDYSCNKFEIFQNSIDITHYFKCLDLFGTMIKNLKWIEITIALLLGQKIVD
jgi:hypothetical protein